MRLAETGDDGMAVNGEVVVGRGARAVRFGNGLPLALIAGPCAMENRDHALRTAEALAGIADRKSTRLNSSHSGEARMPSSA